MRREARFVMCTASLPAPDKIAVTHVLRTSSQYGGHPNFCNTGIGIGAPLCNESFPENRNVARALVRRTERRYLRDPCS